jgi:hypothetical protein
MNEIELQHMQVFSFKDGPRVSSIKHAEITAQVAHLFSAWCSLHGFKYISDINLWFNEHDVRKNAYGDRILYSNDDLYKLFQDELSGKVGKKTL